MTAPVVMNPCPALSARCPGRACLRRRARCATAGVPAALRPACPLRYGRRARCATGGVPAASG